MYEVCTLNFRSLAVLRISIMDSTPPKPSKGKGKRTIEQVIADIPNIKDVKFEFLQISSKHDPILNFYFTINSDDPYALFILY
jgi:hypothetical protein